MFLRSILMAQGNTVVTPADTNYAANTANLNGSSQHFSAGNPAALQLTGSQSHFIWVKPDSVASNTVIIGKYSYSNNQRAFILRSNGSTAYDAIVSSDGSSTVTTVSSTTAPAAGEAVRIGWVYNGSTLKFYLNGSEEGSVSYSSGVHNSTTDYIIGSYGGPNLGVDRYDGAAGMLRVWSKALSAAEVTEEYNSGNIKCFNDLSTGLKTNLIYSPRLCNWTGTGGDELVDQSTSSITTTNTGSTPFNGTGLTIECS
jgi:hypothetical protein